MPCNQSLMQILNKSNNGLKTKQLHHLKHTRREMEMAKPPKKLQSNLRLFFKQQMKMVTNFSIYQNGSYFAKSIKNQEKQLVNPL